MTMNVQFEILMNEIYKCSYAEKMQVLDNCIDDLGVCDSDDSQYILGICRSRLYQVMNENPDKTLSIGKHKYIAANWVLNAK